MNLIKFIEANPELCLWSLGCGGVLVTYLAYIIGWECGKYCESKRTMQADFEAAMQETTGKEGRS